LHKQVFACLLQRLHDRRSTERVRVEEACLEHLDRLVDLLLPAMAWPTIGEAVCALREAGPALERTAQHLGVYEGYVAVRTGDYGRGETLLTIALGDETLLGELRCHALNGMASIAFNQTRYDQALAWQRQLYEHACATGRRIYQGVALLNQGGVYHELGRHHEAHDYAVRSLEIYREQGDQTRAAFATYVAGNSALSLGRWDLAEQYLEDAAERLNALGNTSFLVLVKWGQGYLCHILGDEARSEEHYRRALALAGAASDGEPIAAMDCLLYLGLLYETQGRWAAALDEYAAATALARQIGNDHRLVLIHYRRGMAHAGLGHWDEALAAYREGVETLDTLREATLQETVKISLLGTVQQLYEALILACLHLGHREDAFDYAERARSRAFLDLLTAKSPDLAASADQRVATLADVQAGLPEGALLLEYFTTGVLPRGEHLLNQLPPDSARLRGALTQPARVVLFAVTRGAFSVRELEVDPNSLRPSEHDPGPGRRLLRGRLPVTLHQRLIAPVAPLVRDCRQLYLVPHGPLHYVPFMALRSAAGDYLLDTGGPSIALAPSATILLRNCLARPPRPAAGALALGYNDRGDRALRYAEAEARYVARLTGGQAWTGPEPKSARLLAAARAGQSVRWLHFAGHAIYNPHDPLESVIRLGEDDDLSARAILDGLEVQAELVTISACTSGISHVMPGDELLGLPRALLYAGAPSVVCTLWEAHDLVTLLVMERFYTDLWHGRPAAAALRDAQVAVREMTEREVAAALARWPSEEPQLAGLRGGADDGPQPSTDGRPFADPFYWAPFMLIGRPD
jgi:CHAT domain-containing protein/tetratricopeptide (TPR) repeat protein